MNELEKQQLKELLEWKKSWEDSKTIPLVNDNAIRDRFGVTIQDEGVNLTHRDSINFAGAGVTVTDNGDRTLVTIPGGGGSGSPGGSDTQVQFNDGGVFGGDAGFTFNDGTYTLGLGVENVTSTLRSPDATTDDTEGGSLNLTAGDANGAAAGGRIEIVAGTGESAGTVTIDAGAATGDVGGKIILTAGQGDPGGDIEINAGDATGVNKNGGNVYLIPGALTGTGDDGYVIVNTVPIATTADGGHFVITKCAGTPTSTPTVGGAMIYDTSNNKLYVYNGAWKSVTLT